MADENEDAIQPTEEESADDNFQNDESKEQTNGEETPQCSVFTEGTQSESLRRSQRTRTLTEKGQSLQEAKLNDLTNNFERVYKKWKYHINLFKRMVKSKDIELIPEAVSVIDTSMTDICNIHDEIRKIQSPDIEMRRRCDVCMAISETARAKARCLLEEDGDPNSIPWPDSESVYDSSSSSASSRITYKSRSISGMSKQSSLVTLQQRQEAAAEVAATEEVIKIIKTASV